LCSIAICAKLICFRKVLNQLTCHLVKIVLPKLLVSFVRLCINSIPICNFADRNIPKSATDPKVLKSAISDMQREWQKKHFTEVTAIG